MIKHLHVSILYPDLQQAYYVIQYIMGSHTLPFLYTKFHFKSIVTVVIVVPFILFFHLKLF
jgi:predicted membrane-bound dolichyl-phosphate-mannose-protein mannosyltransferase